MKWSQIHRLAIWLGLLTLLISWDSARTSQSASRIGYSSPLDTLLEQLPLRPQSLQFPNGRGNLDSVHASLTRLLLDGQGSLRIAHVGGSHVQGGWMGDRIRERWWNATATACSRGLILPYRMAGTNTPPRVRTEFYGSWDGTRCSRSRHHGPFGGVGLSAVTFDPEASWWHTASRIDSSLYTTSKLTILAQSNGLVPEWLGRDSNQRAIRTALPEGDGWVYAFDPPVDTLFLGLEPVEIPGNEPQWFRLHGLIAENTSCHCEGLIYHEIGNNGASTASVLRGVADDAFERDWKALRPDLVILGLGINDAHGAADRFDAEAFAHRYDSLLQAIQVHAPECAFLFLTNTDSFYNGRPNPSALLVREAIFEVASRHEAAVFDLFDAMGGLGSMSVWDEAGFARDDRVHFNRAGYRVIADLYWDALLQDWANSASIHNRRTQRQSDADGPQHHQPAAQDSTTWKS